LSTSLIARSRGEGLRVSSEARSWQGYDFPGRCRRVFELLCCLEQSLDAPNIEHIEDERTSTERINASATELSAESHERVDLTHPRPWQRAIDEPRHEFFD
jgi:hypothetical protein